LTSHRFYQQAAYYTYWHFALNALSMLMRFVPVIQSNVSLLIIELLAKNHNKWLLRNSLRERSLPLSHPEKGALRS